MSLAGYGGQILQQAADIARQIARRESTRLRWATVTSTDPLLIRYDGEAEASVVPPQTLAACTAGDRVRVAVYRGQATILGVAGGIVGEWHTLALLNGWSAVSPLRWRQTGRTIELRGEVIAGASSVLDSAHPIAMLPADVAPPDRCRTYLGWGSAATYVAIDIDGSIWTVAGASIRTASPGYMFGHISYGLG